MDRRSRDDLSTRYARVVPGVAIKWIGVISFTNAHYVFDDRRRSPVILNIPARSVNVYSHNAVMDETFGDSTTLYTRVIFDIC